MNRHTTKKIDHGGCVCHVVPYHMLKSIADNGDPEQRGWAIKTIVQSARLSARREIVAHVPVDTPSIAGGLRRTIFDAQHTDNLPGVITRSEGQAAGGDIVVNEAYDGSGATYEMFCQVFKRNSIDNLGLRLDSTVHYSKNYDNAFWDGRQMVYGDGDGKLFNRFTAAIDVIGHELAHGITQYEAGLVYWDQPGALNEHMSDVFGALVKQWVLKQSVKNADWYIGTGLLASGVRGAALRSMRDPGSAYNDPLLGKDPQPGHMRNYVRTNDDNGGVHINSGIPNRAFYVACEILDDQWRPANIWYKTLCDRLKQRSTFNDCVRLTTAVAAELYGARSAEQKAVKKAWQSVGLAQ